MANIREISPNNYALFNNGELLTGFKKIEKVAPNSNYYCLWPTSEYFYLYHIVKEKYALNNNNISAANKFSKIDFYSEETNSFVAYRKDENYAHIIFEDGHVESTTFCYVGIEIDGIRTVKTCSDRWFFYDTKNRIHLLLTGSRGYKLDGNLEMILTSNIFVINKNKKGKQLVLYSQGKAPVYSRDYFDLIEQVNKTTFIGKLYNRNIYCIIKSYNIVYPIGYYTSLPKYIMEQHLFIAQKGVSYCFIKGEKEIQNYQWQNDSFIFHGNYVFNRIENSSTWKIFNIHNGQEIPTNFKNIRIQNDKEFHLLVEVEGTSDKKVYIEDIDKIYNKYYISKEQKQLEQRPKTVEKGIAQSIINSSCNIDAVPTTNENLENPINKKDTPNSNDNGIMSITINKSELPTDINYYVFVPWVSIKDNRISCGSINCDILRGPTFIVWFILEEHSLIITESRRTKVHNIIYIKKESPTTKSLFENKHFWVYRELYPITIKSNIKHIDEDDLEKQLYRSMFEVQQVKTGVKEQQTQENRKKQQKISSTQSSEEKTGNSLALEETLSTSNIKEVKFTFDHVAYELQLDEEWNIGDIFYKKRVQSKAKEDIIVILYDFETDKAIKSKDGNIYYHIYGEGKDKRFNHYFGQNYNTLLRSSIPNKDKRILLFKQSKTNKLLFHDEIKCVDYYTTREEDCDRTVIIFKFKSLLRNSVNNTSTLKDIKEGKKCHANEIGNENINNLSNITNMPKLQELYDTKKKLQNLGIELNAELEKQLSALEEEFIQNEIVPIISQTIAPILKPIKRKITFVLEYNSEEDLKIYISNKSV